jgi:hypothetical protein
MIWGFTITILVLISLLFVVAGFYDFEVEEPEVSDAEHKTYELKERYKWLKSNMRGSNLEDQNSS